MYLGRKLSSIVVRSEAIFSCSDDVPDWESGDAQTADDSLSWDRNALLQDPKRKRGGHYVSHGGSLERPASGSLGLVHDLGIRTMRGPEVVSRARDSRDRSLCITEGWNAGHFLFVFRNSRVFPHKATVCCRIICTMVYTFYPGMLEEALLSGQVVGVVLNLGSHQCATPSVVAILDRGRSR